MCPHIEWKTRNIVYREKNNIGGLVILVPYDLDPALINVICKCQLDVKLLFNWMDDEGEIHRLCIKHENHQIDPVVEEE